MERLTARAGNHTYYHHCGQVSVCPKQGCGACEITQKAKDKLADYEDMEEKLEEIWATRKAITLNTQEYEEWKAAILEMVTEAEYMICVDVCKYAAKAFTGKNACTDAMLKELYENHCAKCPLGKIL